MSGRYLVKTINSTYDVDFDRHTISGGSVFPQQVSFSRIEDIEIGLRMFITLSDSRCILTSPVTAMTSVAAVGGRNMAALLATVSA